MTAHDHTTRVDGCFRCDLSSDEAGVTDDLAALREAVLAALNYYQCRHPHGYPDLAGIGCPECQADAVLAALAPHVTAQVEQRDAARHLPAIAESSTPDVWNVFCDSCSVAAQDYIYPCRVNGLEPPPRQLAALEQRDAAISRLREQRDAARTIVDERNALLRESSVEILKYAHKADQAEAERDGALAMIQSLERVVESPDQPEETK